jgi:hypothetical protein
VRAVICYSQHNAVQRDCSLSGDCIFCMTRWMMLYGCKDPKFCSSKYFFDVIKKFSVTLCIYIQFRVFYSAKRFVNDDVFNVMCFNLHVMYNLFSFMKPYLWARYRSMI